MEKGKCLNIYEAYSFPNIVCLFFRLQEHENIHTKMIDRVVDESLFHAHAQFDGSVLSSILSKMYVNLFQIVHNPVSG